jgi:hypothetical protein
MGNLESQDFHFQNLTLVLWESQDFEKAKVGTLLVTGWVPLKQARI